MELDPVLRWIVALWTGVPLFQLARARRWRTGWFAAAALVAAIAGVTWLVAPDWSGRVGAVAWLVLVGLPLFLQRLVNRLVEKDRLAWAARVAQVARLLHPLDGMWRQPTLLGSMARARTGDAAGARVVDAKADPTTAQGRVWHVEALRLRGAWDELAAWVWSLPASTRAAEPYLVVHGLRALGETGRRDLLVATAIRESRSLDKLAPAERDHALLFLFAFAGRPARVARLLDENLAALPANLRAFWRATAALAAGSRDEARAAFAALAARTGDDARMRDAVARRLADSAPDAPAPPSLAPEHEAYLDALERGLDAAPRPTRPRRPWATWALVAANVAMFAVELAVGHGDSLAALDRLGAVVPALVVDGHEWWRVLAATFLHAGWLHITLNMLGLLALGIPVERALGRARYLALYLVAAVGGNLTAIAFASSPHMGLVGASGGVMATVGALAALHLRRWLRHRHAGARNELAWALGIIALQAYIDTTMPNVSGTAHLGGAALGFVLGLVLVPRRELQR